MHRYAWLAYKATSCALAQRGLLSFEVTRLTDCVYIDGQLPVIYRVSLTERV